MSTGDFYRIKLVLACARAAKKHWRGREYVCIVNRETRRCGSFRLMSAAALCDHIFSVHYMGLFDVGLPDGTGPGEVEER